MTLKQLTKIQLDIPDNVVEKQIKDIWDHVAKPLESMGKFEPLLCKIGSIQKTTNPDLSKKVICVMCADNGIVAEGVSQSGQEVTALVAKQMGLGSSNVCRLAKKADIRVIPIDIGMNCDKTFEGVRANKVSYGTKDFLLTPAMTEEETLQAIEIGIHFVKEQKENGVSMIGHGEMGIGNTTTSTAITASLLGLDPKEITGPGAGLSGEGISRKIQVITQAIKKYDLYHQDAFTILRSVGGLDIAGLVGICIGGAIYHVPIILDGVISLCAALVAQRLLPGVKDYLIASHMGKEPASQKIIQKLMLDPIIHANLALGEGTGAALLMGLLDQAFVLYQTPLTFEEAKVEQYHHFK